jgi:hypothetical protein
MANVANVKVLAGNQVQVSGTAVQLTGSGASLSVSSSQVIVTGSVFTNGNVTVGGTLTAANLVVNTITSASTVFTSGSTQFGDNLNDSHTFSGSVNIFGLVSSSVGFSGSAAGLTGLVKSVVAGPNISASAPDVNGAVTVRLSSSITSDLTTLTGLTNLSSSTGSFAVLSASAAEFSGNVLIYGTASLSSNPDAAYVRYTGLPEDKILIYPGLKVSGSTVISGNLDVTGSVSASSFTGSGAGLTNLPAANLTGIVPLANGGTGINASGVTSGQLLIGSGSTLQLGDLVAGSNIGITKGSGSITIAVTGSLGVSQVSSSDPNIIVTNGSGPTASLDLAANITVDTITSSVGSFLSGSVRFGVTEVTGAYTVVASDNVILANATAGTFNVAIPSTPQAGRVLILKKSDGTENSVNIVSGTIDGEASFGLNGPYQSITIVAGTGNNWNII